MFRPKEKLYIVILLRFIISVDKYDLESCHKTVDKYSKKFGLLNAEINKPLNTIKMLELKTILYSLSENQKEKCFEFIFQMLYEAGIREFSQFYEASLFFDKLAGFDSSIFMNKVGIKLDN